MSDQVDYVPALAEAVLAYIKAKDHRGRFEQFAASISDRAKMTGYLREVEIERLLNGGDGPVVQKSAVESVASSGVKPSENRDALFFAVTELISASEINLTGRAAASAAA